MRNLVNKGYVILAYYDNKNKAKPYINGFKKLGLKIDIEKKSGENTTPQLGGEVQ